MEIRTVAPGLVFNAVGGRLNKYWIWRVEVGACLHEVIAVLCKSDR